MTNFLSNYGTSLSLFTDFYQLTMANAYWKSGLGSKEAVFHLYFRQHPFQGGYAIAAGLEYVIDYIERFRFDESDLEYLLSLKQPDGDAYFSEGFIDYLRKMRFSCDIDAIPEGTVVFAQEPMLRVTGPIIQCQLLESVLLNIVNFQTLIATKAARMCRAVGDDGVLEFGLRRAQGIDGALTASRAAYIGGCSATSNVLAGKLFGIPVKGTMAHSWVMAFDDEFESFQEYARAMPGNCVFLVDTYDSIKGTKKAIEVGKWLREQGKEFLGIRLDSGDLTHLSRECRNLLDEAGFPEAKIFASNDLDEYLLEDLKQQGAQIAVWGVGTRLVTAKDQAALGGVYKLSAIRNPEGEWHPRLKLSEQISKVSTPGVLQVRRWYSNGLAEMDVIYDESQDNDALNFAIDPMDVTRRKKAAKEWTYEDLLQPIFRAGKLLYKTPSLEEIRERVLRQMECIHYGVLRYMNPHQYVVGLDPKLHALKIQLITKIREKNELSDD